jgi:hypothetical protein
MLARRLSLERRARGEPLVEINRGSRKHEGQTGACRATRLAPSPQSDLRLSDHGYGKKSPSFRQLTAGNNQSLSSNFLTSATNLGGNSAGTL